MDIETNERKGIRYINTLQKENSATRREKKIIDLKCFKLSVVIFGKPHSIRPTSHLVTNNAKKKWVKDSYTKTTATDEIWQCIVMEFLNDFYQTSQNNALISCIFQWFDAFDG